VIGWQGSFLHGTKGEMDLVEQVVRLTVNLTVNERQLDVFKSILKILTEIS
jgi:hypothetical protein